MNDRGVDKVDAYLKTISRLEPDINMIDHDAGIASIAISLKRIADALDKRPSAHETIEASETIFKYLSVSNPTSSVSLTVGLNIINALAQAGFKVIR